jgi:hypothetical protein
MFLNNQFVLSTCFTPLPAGACFRLHFCVLPTQSHQHRNTTTTTTTTTTVIIFLFSNRMRTLLSRPERSRAHYSWLTRRPCPVQPA